MIELKNVYKSYDHKDVLKGLNLMIPDGCIYGLCGPNGAGKSTLLHLLSDVIKPDQGKILFDGEFIHDDEEIKSKIMLVSDEPFYPYLSMIEDIKEFYKLWYSSFDEDYFYKLINTFSLPEDQTIREFSKGMKRQLSLSLSFAIYPEYLFLDEAFDGLDPVIKKIIKKEIISLTSDKKMTILISSHNLRELEDICDYFGILKDGKIITSGDLYEAKNNIHKIQMAFREEIDKDMFKNLDLLSFSKQSKVINIVVKGDIEKIKDYLDTLDPLMLEVLNIDLEEIFIYEMERKGYGIYD